jgi:GGDEF domain-containing protein
VPTVLMADADAALYRAKKAGRATFAIHGQAMAPARRARDRGDPG